MKTTSSRLPVTRDELATLLLSLGSVLGGKEMRHAKVKGGNDVVTAADLAIERLLRRELVRILPGSSVSGEELGSTASDENREWQWVVDPIDGTINFSRDLTMYSTAVALEHFGTPVLGAVYLPEKQEVVAASIGEGTILFVENASHSAEARGHCQVSSRSADKALISLMLTPKFSNAGRDLTLQLMSFLVERTLGVRILVSQAFECAALALGRLDAVVSLESTGGWTRSVGTSLVLEAGGQALVCSSPSKPKSSGFVLAATPEILDLIAGWMSEHGFGENQSWSVNE